MFTVTEVRRRYFFWVSVGLRADEDVTVTGKRLRVGKVGAPVLDTRILRVKAGQTFVIRAHRSDRYAVGDQVDPDQVANKLPIGLKWQTLQTA